MSKSQGSTAIVTKIHTQESGLHARKSSRRRVKFWDASSSKKGAVNRAGWRRLNSLSPSVLMRSCEDRFGNGIGGARFTQPPTKQQCLTEDRHVLPDELCVEGWVGGGLAAVEARGEQVDVEEGDGQAHHRRSGAV